ncbi:MAG: NUDIX domain-containing protein [Bacteroidota bacterium]
MAKRFNIRVYGILVQNNSVLVSDEFIKGNRITKLPGGGLEFGEGTRECLTREFKEELGLDVEVMDHFYTTDFYVSSSFDVNSQVISIYYLVEAIGKLSFNVSISAHNYENKEGAQSIRWISLPDLKDTDFTLIIDRRVGELLMKKFASAK